MLPVARRLTALLAAAVLAPAPSAQHDHVHLPDGFELVNAGGSFSQPVGMAFLPDGRAFVIQKNGVVRLWDDGLVQSQHVISLWNEVNNWGDRGLLGVAVHPGYVPDGGPTSWIYLLYTVSPVPGLDVEHNYEGKFSFSRLTRYQTTEVDGQILAIPESRHILLGNQLPDGSVPDCIASLHASHSNGSLHFAGDGSLFLGAGDGAHFDFADFGGADPEGFDDYIHPKTGLKGPTPREQDSGSFRAQDLRSLAGKILRLDPETGGGYSSNPFFDGDPYSNPSRIWTLGLRNPFRFTLVPGSGSTDPSLGQPDTVLIGDVGNGKWEAVFRATGGENYGWPCFESGHAGTVWLNHQHPPNPYSWPQCSDGFPGVPTSPLMAYRHWDGAGSVLPLNTYLGGDETPDPNGFAGSCVIGGPVYTGGSYPPEYDGLLFFADYADRWMRALEVGPAGNLVGVRDFGEDFPAIVDIERHPLTGDLYLLSPFGATGGVFQLRYGASLTPEVELVASPLGGPTPLRVSFDGTGSSDPEGAALTYTWDFGDGSPISNLSRTSHTYLRDGVFTATLTVSDPGGLSAQDSVTIAAGTLAPTVEILLPEPGLLFSAPEVVDLVAVASDPDGAELTWTWRVDEYHDTHVHPFVGIGSDPGTFSYEIGLHGEQEDLVYYSISVEVTDEEGLSVTDHIFVYPSDRVVDRTGLHVLGSSLSGLPPSVPPGAGNPDVEVVRDGVRPEVTAGAGDPLVQFDTFHATQGGTAGWVGYSLTLLPSDEFRWVELSFQEGLHAADGGWFESLDVEVFREGVWQSVAFLDIEPPYPFDQAGTPGFDGVHFETYRLSFDPIDGTAIRLVGETGGTAEYASIAELRALAIDKFLYAPSGFADVTDDNGAVIAKVYELTPPGPQGTGNPDPNTIRNGTFPPLGSTSDWAQFDTEHGGDQGDEDWIGYSFPTTKLFRRLLLQEGRVRPEGGEFETLSVETRAKGSSSWTPVTGLQVTPSYPGSVADYEGYLLDFDAVPARGIRVIGDPAGTVGYVSVGELRVYGEVPLEDCGWERLGPGSLPRDTLDLSAWQPPTLGTSFDVELAGLGGSGFAWFILSPLPPVLFEAGGTVFVDPAIVALLPHLSVGPDGEVALPVVLPLTPSFAGAEVVWQGFGIELASPGSLQHSNGLVMNICP
jgi:glucose/arabinose dehydrogenase/PKD repeat protein